MGPKMTGKLHILLAPPLRLNILVFAGHLSRACPFTLDRTSSTLLAAYEIWIHYHMLSSTHPLIGLSLLVNNLVIPRRFLGEICSASKKQ